MERDFEIARYEACKTRLLAYESAITALTVGGEKSFSINTGQTVTTVTNQDLSTLEDTYTGLLNQCEALYIRLYGGGSVHMRPAW
jgi:hypothetical protein